MLKRVLKRVANWLFGKYEISRVFALGLGPALPDPRPSLEREGFTVATVTQEQVAAAKSEVVRESSWYGGAGSKGFAVLMDGEIVALEWYWFGNERGDRLVWRLEPGEAESAYIVTAPEMRGQQLAQRVKQYSALEMRALGYHRAYSKIWHSHRASIAANLKAGFREMGMVIEIYPFGGRRRLRYSRRRSFVP